MSWKVGDYVQIKAGNSSFAKWSWEIPAIVTTVTPSQVQFHFAPPIAVPNGNICYHATAYPDYLEAAPVGPMVTPKREGCIGEAKFPLDKKAYQTSLIQKEVENFVNNKKRTLRVWPHDQEIAHEICYKTGTIYFYWKDLPKK